MSKFRRDQFVASCLVLAVMVLDRGLLGGCRRSAVARSVAGQGRRRLSRCAIFAARRTSLADFQDSRAVVVVFLGTECPLATLYAPRLAQLARAIRRPEAWPSSASTRTSRTRLPSWPLTRKRTTSSFRCSRTWATSWPINSAPSARRKFFVLDPIASCAIAAASTINIMVGRQRTRPTREDLAVALTSCSPARKSASRSPRRKAAASAACGSPRHDAQVTYSKHIAPLLNARCVECHRAGEIAPFALTNYDEVAGWAETILEVVDDNRMPPWHANPEYGHFCQRPPLER